MSLLTVKEVEDWVPQASGQVSLIVAGIKQAEALAARYCGRDSLGSESYTEYLDVEDRTRILWLKNYPVTTLTSITEWAQESSPTTCESTDYDTNLTRGELIRDGVHWSVGRQQVKVVYTAGYTASTLPDDLRWALLDLVAFRIGRRGDRGTTTTSQDGLSETREDLVLGIPRSIASQLDPYRRLVTV